MEIFETFIVGVMTGTVITISFASYLEQRQKRKWQAAQEVLTTAWLKSRNLIVDQAITIAQWKYALVKAQRLVNKQRRGEEVTSLEYSETFKGLE